MADQQQLSMLKQGVDAWNKWRSQYPDIQPENIESYFAEALIYKVDLEGADLSQLNLEGVNLSEANLKGADLGQAHLQQSDLSQSDLEGANLFGAHLQGANLRQTHLQESNLEEAFLEGADLREANLERANLQKASLKKADLRWASLKKADLRWANLEGTNLQGVGLEGTELRHASFDIMTNLEDIILGNREYGLTSLADVRWGDVDLTRVDWLQVMKKPDDTHEVHWLNGHNEYKVEVRAYRQLAIILQAQGLNDEADRIAYHAQVLQRKILWRQITDRQKGSLSNRQHPVGLWLRVKKFASYVLSWFLDILAGYGYKPARSFGWYIGINVVCTIAYFLLSETNGFHFPCNTHLIHGIQQMCSTHFVLKEGLEAIGESLASSLTAFHGRGFFPEQFGHGDLRTYIAAIEAVLGLFIEASFIATFTQRFYRK